MFINIFDNIKRPFIWVLRFRNRCGYGVHSPFAFNLITHVIYERAPYYCYKELKSEINQQLVNQPKHWNDNSIKFNRLLFRLVNYLTPNTIVDLGTTSSSSLYLKAGKRDAQVYSMVELDNLPSTIDFLYIHRELSKSEVDNLFALIPSDGVCVVKGIYSSRSMRRFWKTMIDDERTGITFDLYSLGIIFFDKTKIKQHYKVNFY